MLDTLRENLLRLFFIAKIVLPTPKGLIGVLEMCFPVNKWVQVAMGVHLLIALEEVSLELKVH